LIVARAACAKQSSERLERFVLAPRAGAKRLSLLSLCQRQVLFQENAEDGFPSLEKKYNDHFSFLDILNDFPSRLNILA
jgi:hypothetical protein